MNIDLDSLCVFTERTGESLIRASWQGGVAVLLVWAVCRLLPRVPASVQCWLWRIVFVKFLITLIWSAPLRLPLLPPVPAALPALVSVNSVEGFKITSDDPAAPITNIVPDAAGFVEHAQDKIATQRLTPSFWLIGAWGIGIGICLVRLMRIWLHTRRWRRFCTPLDDSALTAEAAALCRRLAIQTPPTLLTASRGSSLPLLVGMYRPAVVLPAEMVHADLAALRLMLAYELAHHRRQDLRWSWLSTVTQILFFFHPMTWLARREEGLAREIACDVLAVEISDAPTADYAAMLLQAVTRRGQIQGPTGSLVALGIADSVSTLKKRLIGLQNPSPLTPLGRLVFTALVSAALLSLAPWRVVAQRPAVRSVTGTEPLPVSREVPAARLSGVVLTPDNKPAVGISVAWMVWKDNGARAIAVAQTDTEGHFHLQPDSAQVYPRGPLAGQIVVWGSGYGLTIDLIKKGKSSITVHLVPAASLGITFLGAQSHPVSDLPVNVSWLSGASGDFPLQGLENLPASFPKFSGITDRNGSLRMQNLPQGAQVRLKVADSRYAALATGDTVSLPSGMKQVDRLIRLTPGATIRGQVLSGPENKPVPNVFVNAMYRDPSIAIA